MITIRTTASAALLFTAALAPPSAAAQIAAEPHPHVVRSGPTLRAQAVTADALMERDVIDPTAIRRRHAAFERELARAFGFQIATGPASDPLRASFVHEMGRWVATRWSDSRFDEWARSAMLTYTKIEQSASFERRGFDMAVDVDDVARGKLGIRVDRALD